MTETTANDQQLNPLFSSLFPEADQTTSTSLFDDIQQSFSDSESDKLLAQFTEIWLPKNETADILKMCRNDNNRKISRSLLTKPALEFDRILDDPVLDIVCQLEKSHSNLMQKRRQIATADNVRQDVSGMRTLIESGCYRAAINLSERLLKGFDNLSSVTDAEKAHTIDSLKIWYWRLALLKRTGFEPIAQKEAKRFKDLDQPDLYFEFYPDVYGSTRTGSMVPFEMRLLIADFGSFKDRLRKLFRVLSICKQIVRNLQQDNTSNTAAIDLWQQRCKQTTHSLINCAFAKKDFSLAIDLVNECIANCCETDSHSKHTYYCLLGCIYLETCDLKMAKLYFAKIPAEKTLDIRSLINFSLIAIGEHNYADAETFLKQLHEMKPNMLPIANNLAACAIRQNRMNDMRQFLDRIIQINLTNQLFCASSANQQVLLLLWQIYESRLTKMAGARAKQSLLKDLAMLNCDIPQHILVKFKNFL